MLLFFFFGALLILHFNQMRFLPMGHIGRNVKTITEDDEDNTGLEKHVSKEVEEASREGNKEMVAKEENSTESAAP